MKKVLFIFTGLALVLALFSVSGCENQAPADNTASPEQSDFNLIFKYGVTARNELNTFNGTYTKDLILDPPVTTELRLSEEEMDRIYQKMVEIDFFNYPDEFSVTPTPGERGFIIEPYERYYFKVECDSKVKELRWKDILKNSDEKAAKLRELISLIKGIIESREEYKKLPAPSGGYA
jgi:hypothetical protein